MEIKFAYTILYVQDVKKAMEFFQKTFEFKQKMITPENDYGEIITGETTLAFANQELGESNFKNGFTMSHPNNKPFGIELAFTTSNVEELVSRAISNGAELLSEPIVKPWGQKVGYVRDPNGFIIEICTPIKG